MLQATGRLRFSVKALEHRGVVGYSGSNRLEGNEPINDRVARPVHHSHRSVTKLSKNLIFAQLFQPMLLP
jgi:hypothetical protein